MSKGNVAVLICWFYLVYFVFKGFCFDPLQKSNPADLSGSSIEQHSIKLTTSSGLNLSKVDTEILANWLQVDEDDPRLIDPTRQVSNRESKVVSGKPVKPASSFSSVNQPEQEGSVGQQEEVGSVAQSKKEGSASRPSKKGGSASRPSKKGGEEDSVEPKP